MLHRIDDGREITVDVNGGASEFNAESERLQRLVGVDPSRCMKLGFIAGLECRTTLGIFFPALKDRIWASVERGPWRLHDKNDHESRIRNMHPSGVDMVVRAAVVGDAYLNNGHFDEAEHVADLIDGFTSDLTGENALDSLKTYLSLESEGAPQYSQQVAHMMAINNIVHQERMLESSSQS